MWKTPKKQNPKAEHCVLCGIETEYSKETPIEKRQGYVVGAGQLCYDCYKNLYPKGQDHHG